MDTLHTVLRSLKAETKGRRDHISVFREFLGHLDRAAKRRSTWQPKVKSRNGKR